MSRSETVENIVPGALTPVLEKHSKSFSLIDCVSFGVDRMQRSFEPMRKQVEARQKCELTDVTAKVVTYEAFVEGKLEAPKQKHLARTVHDLYFEPKYEEFKSRTIWSLSNAFTSAFQQLEPIPQFRATAKLGNFWRLGSRKHSSLRRYRPDRGSFIVVGNRCAGAGVYPVIDLHVLYSQTPSTQGPANSFG